jgi:fatty acid desaturase
MVAAFDRETFRAFFEVQPGRVVWTFTHIWLAILTSLAVAGWIWRMDAGWPKVWLPLIIFYIGTRHNAFAVQIHEASHNLLFSGHKWNDTFCNFFGAYWVMNDVASYRAVHLVHHSHLHLDTDPDLDLYSVTDSVGRYQIAKLVFQDLSWVTAVRRILAYRRRLSELVAAERTSHADAFHLLGKLACQAVLLAAACVVFGWRQGSLFYFAFWLLPLFSVFPAIIRLRIVTEHFSPEPLSGAETRFVSRTTSTRWLEIYLFGCDMEYHFEHHILPAIPHPQLAKLHAALVRKGFFEQLPQPAYSESDYLSDGYLRFWARLLAGSVRPVSRSAVSSL